MKSPEKERYEYLRELYPPVIHLEQFREICQISKRKGSWILQNGVVPCLNSSKQTRRFTIKLDDVIQFLQERDAGLNQDKIPIRIFKRGTKFRARPAFAPVNPECFTSFLEQKWQAEPDALTTEQAATVANCHPHTVFKWIQIKLLSGILYRNAYMIPKVNLIQLLAKQSSKPPYSTVTYPLIEEYTNALEVPAESEMTMKL